MYLTFYISIEDDLKVYPDPPDSFKAFDRIRWVHEPDHPSHRYYPPDGNISLDLKSKVCSGFDEDYFDYVLEKKHFYTGLGLTMGSFGKHAADFYRTFELPLSAHEVAAEISGGILSKIYDPDTLSRVFEESARIYPSSIILCSLPVSKPFINSLCI